MMTELHDAVCSGDIALVQVILQRDPSCVNDRNSCNQTALHVVFEDIDIGTQADNRLPILQILLHYGADVDARQYYRSQTPLHVAVDQSQIEAVKLLLENRANPNLRDDYNRTALHNAALMTSEKRIVDLLLQHGADINAVDSLGRTPLDIAINIWNSIAAQALVDTGAKASETFYALFERGDRFLINLFVSNEAKIDLDGRFSLEALYFLCMKHDLILPKAMLIEQGVDVEQLKCIVASRKMTELHVAAQEMDEYQVRALLASGADVNAKNIFDETPLHLLFDMETSYVGAIKRDVNRIYRIAKLLIEAGADLYARDLKGFSPLQFPVHMEFFNIINLMLSKIAGIQESTLTNLNSISWPEKIYTDCKDVYPLAVAILYGYEEVVDRLIEMGHHVEIASNVNFKSPLYYAIEKPHYRILKLLLEAGCLVDECYPYSVPWFYLKELDNDTSKFICLLWEFNCYPIIRTALIDAFWHIIHESNAKKLSSLLVFYYKIGLRSNKLNKDFISMTVTFNSNERLSSTLASCDEQISELKKHLICGNKSKYDLLTMKLDSLVNFLNNKNNLKVIEELHSSLGDDKDIEIYELAMKVRIDLAIEKRKLLDSAKYCLNESFQDILDLIKIESLPDEIICNILSHLNIRELKKMTVKD